MKVEIHTSFMLGIGQELIGRLDGVGESQGVILKGRVGIRERDLTYLSEIPEYTSLTSSDVVEAMKKSNLSEVVFKVVEAKGEDASGRHVYILNFSDKKLNKALKQRDISYIRTMKDIESCLDNISNSGELDIPKLVKIALDEVKNSLGCSSVVKQFYVQGAATQGNPNKPVVVNLINQGESVPLELCETKSGIVSTVYDGRRAGEVVFENDEEIDLSSVKSVTASMKKGWGYYIDVEMECSSSTQENTQVNKDERLFIESLKSELNQMISDGNSVTVEEIVDNKELISKVCMLVNQDFLDDKSKELKTGKQANIAIDVKDGEEALVKKATKDEMREIAIYLADNGVPSHIIQNVISSQRKYPVKYLDRIPSKGDFTLWQYSGEGENLLKLAMVAIHHGLNIRLEGGKGAGKNTLLKTIAWVTQRPYFSQSANRDTDITHLFGDKTIEVEEINGQAVQKVVFQKELLIEAMEIGGIYELGEGNACRPEVTMALHSILDSRREVDVNGYKLVKAHPQFVFTTTMNLDYEGCNSMNQAFRDRFITLEFPSPMNIEGILKEACPNASIADIKVCNKIYSDILARVGELQSDEIVTIRGYINALTMAEDIGIKTALRICVAQNVTDDMMLREELLEMIDNAVK